MTGEALRMREQQPCTGLQELAHGTCPMSSLEYKGYKKELQEKVFLGSITYMNVTLIALVRQGGSWARARRLKELGMKQERLF